MSAQYKKHKQHKTTSNLTKSGEALIGMPLPENLAVALIFDVLTSKCDISSL